MKKNELFEFLQRDFQSIIRTYHFSDETIAITTKSLTPEEAIGITKRKDFPILNGSEVMIQAKFRNSYGQAFSDATSCYNGNLKEISELPITDNNAYNRSIFIASYNALKNELRLCNNVIHCRNEGPELCSKRIFDYLKAHYDKNRILLVGYQPAMIEKLSTYFPLRVLDLNPVNVGAERYGLTIEDGILHMDDAITWADLILCTGSSLCNGSIINYLDLDKEVFFFGTTISGAADILNAKRLCFSDQVQVNQSF
ncbi:DUF364 domain-containing protein [Eubacteriaceae bacterium ES3]|nr:DUF364 domain-containing protein [Eubacteriaceae bacterium ES3]